MCQIRAVPPSAERCAAAPAFRSFEVRAPLGFRLTFHHRSLSHCFLCRAPFRVAPLPTLSLSLSLSVPVSPCPFASSPLSPRPLCVPCVHVERPAPGNPGMFHGMGPSGTERRKPFDRSSPVEWDNDDVSAACVSVCPYSVSVSFSLTGQRVRFQTFVRTVS